MKKGFTLVELLAVLVIIGIISIISVTSITSLQGSSKDKLYREQVTRIEESAKLWATQNGGLLYNNRIYYLSLSKLIEENFLESSNIYDPRDNSVMNGCVGIIYDNDKYTYSYDESCGRTIYAIDYDLRGGEEKTNPSIYSNETVTFTLNNPTKLGNTFLGWSGTGITGTLNSVTIPKGSSGNKSYTANWSRNLYTITYNLNDGTFVTSNPSGYYVDDLAITIMPPVKNGYTFAGWTGTGLSGITSNLIIPSGSIGNKTYTANWTMVNYTISYNLDNGMLTIGNRTTYDINTQTFVLNNPIKNDYRFIGWEGTDLNAATTTVTISKGSTGNRTYTAKWALDEYTIIYDCNGGSGSTPISTHTRNNNGKLSRNGCYKPLDDTMLYGFLGWSLSRTATVASYDDAQIVNNVGTGNNVTLYAIWGNLITYTGTYTFIKDDFEKWRIKFLTDGDLTIFAPLYIDAFLVGGGGGGGVESGGGGGYTVTKTGIPIRKGITYTIDIGNGGSKRNDGEDTTAFGYTVAGGKCGGFNGGDGGSGGGGEPGWNGGPWYDEVGNMQRGVGDGGSGGSNGGNGGAGTGVWGDEPWPKSAGSGGRGQGTTTREFGESTGTLYSGGGGGFRRPATGSGGGGTNTGGGGNSDSTGGTGIVVIRNIPNPGIFKTLDGIFTYTGLYEYIDDGDNNWRIKFLSSGTLTANETISVDAFLVGAGGSGASESGGGGGYTLTERNFSIQNGISYLIEIGQGALNTDGASTTAFGFTALGGKKGNVNGGDGGSGGGASGGWSNSFQDANGNYTFISADGGYGGSDGGNGVDGAGYWGESPWPKSPGTGGKGQGTTTREFGESSGTLYSGGGGGLRRLSFGSGGGQTNTGGGGNISVAGGSGIVVIRNVR